MIDNFLSHSAEVLALLFLIITFALSGFEKIYDWSGNINFISDHFKNSPLKNSVPFLLSVLLVLEITVVILMIMGLYDILTSQEFKIAQLGAIISAISLLFMLIGQRLAKDYNGAMNLAVYFIINLFLVFLLQ